MKKLKYMIFIVASTFYIFTPRVLAYTKTETVYTKLHYDGTVEKTRITNKLLAPKDKEIEDNTELFDLLIVNKKENVRIEDQKIKWKSDGESLLYEGFTKKEEDIKISIKYYFNGKEKNVKEMLGKKGHIKIVYTFDNQKKNTVMIEGKKEELYTPFVVTIGTILKRETAKNVMISNGKVVENENRYVALALALPGLYENMQIDAFQNYNDVTLEYDTESFLLSQTYFVATPKLIEKKDMTFLKEAESMYTNIDALKKSVDTLKEGTEKLESGVVGLKEGTDTLTGSLNMILTKIDDLQNGSSSITEGLTNISNSLKEFKQNLSQSIDVNKLLMLKQKNEDTILSLQTANTSLESMYPPNSGSSWSQEQIALKNMHDANINVITLLEGNNQAILSTCEAVSSLQTNVTTVITQLENAVDALSVGSSKVTNAVGTLKAGISQIYEGSFSLKEGASSLKDGSSQIKEGMQKLDEQGISKLVHLKNTLQNYTNKVDAMLDLSQKYNGYASNNSTTTNFIYTVPSLKK